MEVFPHQKEAVTNAQFKARRIIVQPRLHSLKLDRGVSLIGFATSTPTTQCKVQQCSNGSAPCTGNREPWMQTMYGLRVEAGASRTLLVWLVSRHAEHGARAGLGLLAIVQKSATQKA